MSEEFLISDGELRRLLKERGVDVGPITDTTRKVYQKKLQKLKAQSRTKPQVKTAASSTKPQVRTAASSSKPQVRAAASSSSVSSGFKRQRTAPNASEKASEPTIKRPKVTPTNKTPWEPINEEVNESPRLIAPSKAPMDESLRPKISPASKIPWQPKRELSKSPREGLYPDLSRLSRVSGADLSPRESRSNYNPALRQAGLGKVRPAMFEVSSPSLPRAPDRASPASKSRLFPAASPGLSEDDGIFPASYDTPSSPHSSSSFMSVNSEAGTSDSPALSPQQGKEKGLFHVVTNFFESGVSRLLNVSSSFSSPRKKLEDVRNEDQSPMQPRHRHVLSPVLEEESSLAKDNSKFSATSGKLPSNVNYDWELQASDVILCKKKDGQLWKLGKGGFGEVFKGIKDGIDEVAVKRIPLEHYHRSIIEQFKQEIDMISKLRHRHIVQFYGACIQPQNCYMVTELMDNDLFSIMRLSREAPKFRWSGIYGKETLIGVASGLNYLHSRNPPVVHRDIKSPNILVLGGLAKIADVGIARTMGASDMTAQKGYSMAWAAPEVVYRRRATEKIDIWSLGVIIWEVVTGNLPKPGRLDMPASTPASLSTLYRMCVRDDPSQRPSALEVTAELRSIS